MPEHRSPVIWSPEALHDIDHLWHYYVGVAGRESADRLLREVAKVVATLDDFPFAGRSRDDVRPGLRSLKNNRPEIVRVLDGRRDIEEIFSEE